MQELPPAGTRIRNPLQGETFIFTHVDDGADEVLFDVLLERGGMTKGSGRQHIHPKSDEAFIVHEGRLKVMVDGVWNELGPGDSIVVPRGTPHLFRNGHDGETLFTTRFSPPQDFLRFFMNMGLNTANDGRWYDPNGEPHLLLLAQRLHAYKDHAYGHGIPVWFQKLLFAVLSPIAWLKGYRLAIPPRR
ncbi:MAG: cupin domain-containing protein [Rhizobiaceae bacterium]